MTEFPTEAGSLGEVEVPSDRLWGAQTQRSPEHFSIGKDLIPCEMITAYAVLKKATAHANHAGGRLTSQVHDLIARACGEILAGQHHDMFPLHVWMSSLMLVTALAPVIGYDKTSAIAHHAMERDITLKAAALRLGYVDEKTFDEVVDPMKMVKPYVANIAA